MYPIPIPSLGLYTQAHRPSHNAPLQQPITVVRQSAGNRVCFGAKKLSLPQPPPLHPEMTAYFKKFAQNPDDCEEMEVYHRGLLAALQAQLPIPIKETSLTKYIRAKLSQEKPDWKVGVLTAYAAAQIPKKSVLKPQWFEYLMQVEQKTVRETALKQLFKALPPAAQKKAISDLAKSLIIPSPGQKPNPGTVRYLADNLDLVPSHALRWAILASYAKGTLMTWELAMPGEFDKKLAILPEAVRADQPKLLTYLVDQQLLALVETAWAAHKDAEKEIKKGVEETKKQQYTFPQGYGNLGAVKQAKTPAEYAARLVNAISNNKTREKAINTIQEKWKGPKMLQQGILTNLADTQAFPRLVSENIWRSEAEIKTIQKQLGLIDIRESK